MRNYCRTDSIASPSLTLRPMRSQTNQSALAHGLALTPTANTRRRGPERRMADGRRYPFDVDMCCIQGRAANYASGVIGIARIILLAQNERW
jgi:hypothetical protein